MINCKNVICDVLMTKQFTPSCTGHLKKADFKSLHSIIDGYEINCKLEDLRRLGYSDEYINYELGHLVNWRI